MEQISSWPEWGYNSHLYESLLFGYQNHDKHYCPIHFTKAEGGKQPLLHGYSNTPACIFPLTTAVCYSGLFFHMKPKGTKHDGLNYARLHHKKFKNIRYFVLFIWRSFNGFPKNSLNVLHNEFNLRFILIPFPAPFFRCPLPHLSPCVSFPLSSIHFICLIFPRRQPYLFTLKLYGRYVLLIQQSKISTNATGMIQVSANTEQFSFEEEKKNETFN